MGVLLKEASAATATNIFRPIVSGTFILKTFFCSSLCSRVSFLLLPYLVDCLIKDMSSCTGISTEHHGFVSVCLIPMNLASRYVDEQTDVA